MAELSLQFSGSGGADTSELTATAEKVMAGETFLGMGTDEKQTGTLIIQSVVNFKIALYATRACIGTWSLPVKGPWSGVRVQMLAGRYPENVNDGTSVYEGSGTSFTASGLTAGTVYYFRAWNYITTNNGKVFGNCSDFVYTAKEVKGSKIFTSSSTWIVPANVYRINIFCVGGGGGAGTGGGYRNVSYRTDGSGGGGGGYTTLANADVVPGALLTISIGAGGSVVNDLYCNGNSGGQTSVSLQSQKLAFANGGMGGFNGGAGYGGKGGSGGGSGITKGGYTQAVTGVGGSNGSNGGRGLSDKDFDLPGGAGQGRTTKAFEETNGTLYAGGGAGGCYRTTTSGGAGGGGQGGENGRDGALNTGGGGGGCLEPSAGKGGSGICIIRWGY